MFSDQRRKHSNVSTNRLFGDSLKMRYVHVTVFCELDFSLLLAVK